MAITTAEVNQQFVLSKCDYFIDVQLWPLHKSLNSRAWLENFTANEIDYAIHLLNSFIYISDDLINEFFVAAYHEICTHLRTAGDSYLRALESWRNFNDNVIITYVTGETPNVTDSGYAFARKARQILDIPEERILSPDEALRLILDHGPRPVVFVDDFVGSGNQFIETWHRHIKLTPSLVMSFERTSSVVRGCKFFYCPLVCTEIGYGQIKKICSNVALYPAHVLSPKYNALHSDSLVWPNNLRAGAFEFLKIASLRAGIPDTGGADVNDWQGFQKLGLTVGFAHCVPDATLPIFYWEENGWKPLIRKT